MEDNELPGDYTYGETPDPIPNSEAKPVRPMVVLMGESRSSPGFIKAECEKHSAFSFAPDSYMGGSSLTNYNYVQFFRKFIQLS
jgi:hypothetical protein